MINTWVCCWRLLFFYSKSLLYTVIEIYAMLGIRVINEGTGKMWLRWDWSAMSGKIL